MRKTLLAAVLVLSSALSYAAPGGASLEEAILSKHGMIAGSEWNQMPVLAKDTHVAGYFGAVVTVADWTERIASERSSQEIEHVAQMILGLTKGSDVSVKWLRDKIDSFYARASNANVQLPDAVLAILKQSAAR